MHCCVYTATMGTLQSVTLHYMVYHVETAAD